MKSLISFFVLLSLKGLSNIFYRFQIGWPKEKIVWKDVRLIVFLNHTSLMEVLYIGFLPISFIRMLSRRMVLPVASKTLERPLVGFLFKIFSPGTVSITRKRDNSWQQLLESIYDDSIIVIAPEGRMKRRTGMDSFGKPMNVKPGVAEILAGLDKGTVIFAYSGGLHHVQVPGEGFPALFKTLKMDIEVYPISSYKNRFAGEVGGHEWRKVVIEDMQHRLETKPPMIDL